MRLSCPECGEQVHLIEEAPLVYVWVCVNGHEVPSEDIFEEEL